MILHGAVNACERVSRVERTRAVKSLLPNATDREHAATALFVAYRFYALRHRIISKSTHQFLCANVCGNQEM